LKVTITLQLLLLRPFLKFVDDLEIRIDSTQKVIHIRSASRVGYSDMGVNRKRTELLKKLFNNEVSKANKSLDTPPKNGSL
jgi:uncharacterized protein (DUF1499 family)